MTLISRSRALAVSALAPALLASSLAASAPAHADPAQYTAWASALTGISDRYSVPHGQHGLARIQVHRDDTGKRPKSWEARVLWRRPGQDFTRTPIQSLEVGQTLTFRSAPVACGDEITGILKVRFQQGRLYPWSGWRYFGVDMTAEC